MITLKTIAEQAGVSVHAVSRVLNKQNKENRPSAIARAKKIRKIAEDLGYRPNVAAQAMKQGSFKSIMLLMSHEPSQAFLSDNTIISIQETLNSLGYRLMFTILPDRLAAEESFPRFFQEHFVDGVLIGISKAIPEWLENLLNQMNIPKVWIGSKREVNCVRHDDYASGLQAAEKLIALGHKKIVYIDMVLFQSCKDICHFSSVDRMSGYKHAMINAGLEPIAINPENYIPGKYEVAYVENEVLKPYQPTAVICYGTTSTRAICYACAKGRVMIPDELSLITWTLQTTVENSVELTSFIPSKQNVGKLSAEFIYDQIQNPGTNKEALVLPFDFVTGESIGPVRARF